MLKKWPDSRKAPDALLKLGYTQYEQKQYPARACHAHRGDAEVSPAPMPRGSQPSACSASRAARQGRLRSSSDARQGRNSRDAPEDHRDLPLPAGGGRHRRHSHVLRAPDRLPAALPVLRHRVRVPRRGMVGAGAHPRACAASSARVTCASRAASRSRRRPVSSCCRRLCDAGYRVSLETSGAMPLADVDPRVVKVVDVKTPGSGEEHRNRYDELAHLRAAGPGQVRDLRPQRL